MIMLVIAVIMIAMFVMNMAGLPMGGLVIVRMVIVSMIMPMLVAVIVLSMVVFGMIMLCMRMACVRLRNRLVGSAIGLERRFDMHDLCTEHFHHVFQHMIPADANALGEYFRRRVPVAEVIGEAHHEAGIMGADFRQLFRRSNDFDQPTIFQHQRIAAADVHGVRQVEQEFGSAYTFHGDAAAVPLVVVQHHAVGGLCVPGALVRNEIRTDHVCLPKIGLQPIHS